MGVRKLPISDRYISRQFRRNIKGNLIRAIVELLTNSYERKSQIDLPGSIHKKEELLSGDFRKLDLEEDTKGFLWIKTPTFSANENGVIGYGRYL